MANKGPLVMMMEASIGEVMLRPVRKSPWLKTTPHKEPMKKNRWSFHGTFSCGKKRETIQNEAAPNKILVSVSPSGEIQACKRDFVSGILIPKIRVTANMMRCPAFLSFCMVSIMVLEIHFSTGSLEWVKWQKTQK